MCFIFNLGTSNACIIWIKSTSSSILQRIALSSSWAGWGVGRENSRSHKMPSLISLAVISKRTGKYPSLYTLPLSCVLWILCWANESESSAYKLQNSAHTHRSHINNFTSDYIGHRIQSGHVKSLSVSNQRWVELGGCWLDWLLYTFCVQKSTYMDHLYSQPF